MNPITHFLVGWVGLERALPSMRDKAIVCLAGVAPDLDGLGIVVDVATRAFGAEPTTYYQDWHRMLGHGLPAALVIAAISAALGTARWRVALLAFVAVHLHFACDVLGSRGTTPADLWPIHYLEPVAAGADVVWASQWPLVGWQNTAITALLLGITLWRATVRGHSPVGLVAARADAAVVVALRAWRARLRRAAGRG